MHGVAHGDLHSALVKPDGIVLTVNAQTSAASPVFPLNVLDPRFVRLLHHVVVDQAIQTSTAIATRAQHFVHNLGRKGKTSLIDCRRAFFNIMDLSLNRGCLGQSKGRSRFRFCLVHIFYCLFRRFFRFGLNQL